MIDISFGFHFLEMEEFHRLPKDSILDTIVMKSEKLSQRYLLITLGYPNSKQLDIKAGDHIQVYPENDTKYVCEIMERLEFDFNKDEVQIWEGMDYIMKEDSTLLISQ